MPCLERYGGGIARDANQGETTMAATFRYQAKKAQHGGWYVLDTRTGAMWPGMARCGAVQLADHFNRKPHTP